MISTLRNAWKIPDLRKRMLFTLAMLFIFRLGANIPAPFIDKKLIANLFNTDSGSVLELFNLMSGGAFKRFTIFALGVYPYITSSIIFQLLTIAIPSLERLAKEGEAGRKKIAQYTRYGTVVFALIQAVGLTLGLFRNALTNNTFLGKFTVILVLTAGTAFLMWLGEQITDKGIGNGISLIIFAGIVTKIPQDIYTVSTLYVTGGISIIALILFVALLLAVVTGVVGIQEGQRRIPVQYAKRVVGRKMYGGQSTHIPLKVLMAGVIPVIFSTSILQFLPTLTMFWPNSGFANFVTEYFTIRGTVGIWIYSLLNFILILGFTYFYTMIQFNPVEYSNNLKQYGGFIPGIRPGKPTSEFLSKVLNRITFIGAVALALIATIPLLVNTQSGITLSFSGTSLLIVVGVALETVKQIEAQMQMRHYKGFLK
ncbi:preprotein translocase subunit SecY [Abyssisolibacter fermentans]|uniref:preprotein translocase subunit SecY n=1 Tax=Abyssisolibacter fermentans TaxID=1766203 RepID=UPI0008328C1D|nr:preprotein translocase subunit SecY [Abyssisolibacter fermentans]